MEDGGDRAEGGFKFRRFSNADGKDRLIDIHVLLYHLERIRWCFIKGAVAVMAAMIVCLACGNWIVQLLKWPLGRAAERQSVSEPSVYLATSTNNLTRLPLPSQPAWNSLFSQKRDLLLQLRPISHNNRSVLGFVAHPFDPVSRSVVALNVYGPVDGFVVAVQVALFGGLILASPFVFYFLGHFLFPLLGQGGVVIKRAVGPWVAIALLLFLAGVAFCFFLLLPVSLYGSVGFAEWMHFEANEWRAESYIGFVCKFMLAMGLGFELPMVIIFLAKIGLIDFNKLKKFRAYWIVLDLVVSAFLTPDGSPVTMLLMAAPLLILYEISIWIVRGMEKRAEAY